MQLLTANTMRSQPTLYELCNMTPNRVISEFYKTDDSLSLYDLNEQVLHTDENDDLVWVH